MLFNCFFTRGISQIVPVLKVMALIGLCGSLSACSLGQIPSFGGGLFGSSAKKEQVAPKTVGLSEERLLAAAKVDSENQDELKTAASRCTQFKIWESDKFVTIYNIGQYGDGMAVRYRGELTKAARECIHQPGLVSVKYGFAGRVLLGPKGQAGTINLPVIVHLVDKSGKKLKSEKVSVPVTVEPGKPIGYFSIVRSINIPLQGEFGARAYKVYVGFEKQQQG